MAQEFDLLCIYGIAASRHSIGIGAKLRMRYFIMKIPIFQIKTKFLSIPVWKIKMFILRLNRATCFATKGLFSVYHLISFSRLALQK